MINDMALQGSGDEILVSLSSLCEKGSRRKHVVLDFGFSRYAPMPWVKAIVKFLLEGGDNVSFNDRGFIMQAVGNNVIVSPTKEEVSATGLILSTNTSARPMHGTVISIGDRVFEVAVGDKVYYSELVFTHKDYDDEVYIVDVSKIFAKVSVGDGLE